MSKSNSLILVAVCLFFNISALAGIKEGGGGKGVLCGQSIMALDLYEAELNGKNPLPPAKSPEIVIRSVSKSLLNHFSDRDLSNKPWINDAYTLLKTEIIDRFLDIPNGQRLPWTDDATLPALRNGCRFVQIAVYANDNHIYRDPEYWTMLPAIDQASLLMHEWIYHRAKSLNAALKSDEARRVVADVLYGEDQAPLLSPIWHSPKKFSCDAGIQGTSHEIFDMQAIAETRQGIAGTAIYFYQLKNYLMTSQTSAFLAGIWLTQLTGGADFHVNTQVIDKRTGEQWDIEILMSGGQGKVRVFGGAGPASDFSNFFCH